jgi:hypothetical protein
MQARGLDLPRLDRQEIARRYQDKAIRPLRGPRAEPIRQRCSALDEGEPPGGAPVYGAAHNVRP